MAFVASALSLVFSCSGWNLWRYVSTDPAATVAASGYFNARQADMNAGDWIISRCNNVNGVHIVATSVPGTVDCLDAQVNSTTNSG